MDKQQGHTHTFATKTKSVLLGKYKAEKGKMVWAAPAGTDKLTIRYCTVKDCPYSEAIDLIRTKA